ncbi:MAG: 1-acyl-sn-glycerol-3-phosphate acyltransferase [Proteobacteria bacterium]|nr:MAG: 1-acyl-sn-glycerol-3-phosphate acyltransferase [Pseudomonadota bacterium]
MNRLRLFYFFTCIIVFGAPVMLMYLPFALLGVVWGKSQRVADVILRQGVRWLLLWQPWLNRDLRIADPARETKPGILMVSNHRSHLDVFMLLSQVTGIRVLAKRSILFALPIAPMILLSRQILVKRGDANGYLRAMDTIRARLRRGETVHVFPEMSRCEAGASGTKNFSVAPFAAALQEGVKILPVVIRGTDSVWAKGESALHKDGRIEMKSLAEVDTTQFTNATELRNEVRRLITESL